MLTSSKIKNVISMYANYDESFEFNFSYLSKHSFFSYNDLKYLYNKNNKLTNYLINNYKYQYLLIGIRIKYRKQCFKLYDIFNIIIQYLDHHQNIKYIVIMTDYLEYIKLYVMLLYDKLIHRRMYIVNLDYNDVYNMIEIGKYYKDFIHNMSGFYYLIESVHKLQKI